MEQLPPSALATRGTWNSAAAGVMSGSSPLAEPHVNVLQLNLSLDAMGAG
jgi:K+-transporting ATPase c subunit